MKPYKDKQDCWVVDVRRDRVGEAAPAGSLLMTEAPGTSVYMNDLASDVAR